MDKDKQTLISIVKAMADSMTGEESTRHWAPDVLWFDIPAFASRGVPPARKMFDSVFSNFDSCQVDIIETDVMLNGDMGIVCTIQKVQIALKSGTTKNILARQTDCFERRNGEWQLVHQHASVPSGGDWDGKIIAA